MMERGSWLRKFLCLWGWHDWRTQGFREKNKTQLIRSLLATVLIAVIVVMGTIVVILAPLSEAGLINIPGLVSTAIFLISLAVFPRVARGMADLGEFTHRDAICIYCHKQIHECTKLCEKEKQDEEYRATLSQFADEKWRDTNDEKPDSSSSW